MSLSFIPLSEPSFKGKEWRYVKECLDSGWVSTAGKFVSGFEDAICGYSGSGYAVSCINGTSGIFIALKLSGVNLKDEVIVPALTFIAPVNAVRYCGAEPVFMDCDNFMNMDPEKLADFCRKECVQTKAGLKNKRSGSIIRAVLPVHVFGNPCDMPAIMDIAAKYRLKVIEDASESIGSYFTSGRYKGRHTGTIAELGVYSFNGNKIITTGGGGMILTQNKRLADKARYLTTQAKDDPVRYIHDEVGYNFRLTNIQAALGLAQLEKLEDFIRNRERNYAFYLKELSGLEGVRLLPAPEGTRPNLWLYSLVVDKKDYGIGVMELMKFLAQKKIQARPVWYLNHLQKPYRKNQAYRIEKAPWFLDNTLSIPSGSSLKRGDVVRVAKAIKAAQRGRKWRS